MERITKTYLEKRVEMIARYYPDISISWAYGRPRVYNADGSRELSPRLPMRELDNWLDGFERGFELARASK